MDDEAPPAPAPPPGSTRQVRSVRSGALTASAQPADSAAPGTPGTVVPVSSVTLPLPTGPRAAVPVQGGRARRRMPGVAPVSLASAAVLVPWIVYLTRSLPRTYLLTGWSSAWVGFDLLLTGALATTGLLARRHHPLWPSAAFASAALLVADAWFDVMTSGTGGLLVPVLSAALLELPLAALLVARAVHAVAPQPVTRTVASQEGATTEG